MTQPQNRGCPKWFLPMAIMAIQNRMGMHYRKNVWWYPHLHTIMIIYTYIFYIILYYIYIIYIIIYILYYIILYYIIYIYNIYHYIYTILYYIYTVRNEILISIRSMVAFPHLRSSPQTGVAGVVPAARLPPDPMRPRAAPALPPPPATWEAARRCP